MDKKDTLIIVLVVLLIISSGAAVYFSQRLPKMLASGEAEKEICDILPVYSGTESGANPYIAQDICRLVLAVEKQDVEICKKAKTKEFIASCFAQVAAKAGNPGLCDSAPADARDQCYSEAARQAGSAATCEKIQDVNVKDNCFYSYASSKGDSSVCEKIKNESSRDGCYMSVAYREPSLCGKIVNAQMKQDCQRNVGR